jgi:hypothetical protein
MSDDTRYDRIRNVGLEIYQTIKYGIRFEWIARQSTGGYTICYSGEGVNCVHFEDDEIDTMSHEQLVQLGIQRVLGHKIGSEEEYTRKLHVILALLPDAQEALKSSDENLRFLQNEYNKFVELLALEKAPQNPLKIEGTDHTE